MSTKKNSNGPCALEGFRAKGWTIRPAARRLGVSITQLHQVLHGKRPSRRLLAKVAELPNRKETQP